MTLSAENVTLELGAKRVLSDASLEVVPGQVTALVGPNGAGKSSLVRLLCGEIAPDRGLVCAGGLPLEHLGVRDQARLRSVVSQSAAMAFDFYVDEVLAMGWIPDPAEPADYDVACVEVVEQCQIGHLLGRKFKTLSGGERQCVQFARALLQIWRDVSDGHVDVRYMLLDEPTANLDLGHEALVLGLARSTASQNVGVLVVLHDIDMAAAFADRVVLLDEGAVAAGGSPGDVLTSELLSRVYQTPVRVEWHEGLGRLVVLR
ncbi:MAG: heme ABC transporter ATP-binding protein [Pseudomonadales bacterium]|nr:heme ABC transporter ATP-binding protein [Pseudomonadales bacterium]